MIGQTISHYRITEKLGEGGMGVVYKAEDLKLERLVALKFPPLDKLASQEEKVRFVREAQVAAGLNHPNICTVYEIDEADGHPFIAMELVEGQSVRDKIRTRPLPLDEALDMAAQAAQGLQAAHEKGVVHRDVKSANLMVTPQGRVKVMDFGLAQVADRSHLTKTGTTLGTVAYMSPEQALAQPLDSRTDIWSLGVVLYEMLTGSLPFQAEVEGAVAYAVIHTEAEPPTARRSGLPVELDHILDKALAKQQDERYQHIEDMLVDLRAVQSGRGGVKPLFRRRKLSRRAVVAGGAVAALGAIVLVGLDVGGMRETLTGGGAAGPQIQSLAVLPLTNFSGDPAQDYFADGMTDALITDLARLGGLKRVIARSSVMRYKGTNRSPREIARELNVDALVTGAVLRSDDRVRITVQLIDPASGEQLWADRYERDLRDVLSLQNEILSSITGQLEVRLTPREQALLARARPVDPEAYEAYLKGRVHWFAHTPEDVETAHQYFQQALEKDPNFTLAHVGMGYVMVYRGSSGMPPREMLAELKNNERKMLELDDTLPEVHEGIADVKFYYEWDWEGADREYKLALESQTELRRNAHLLLGFPGGDETTSGSTDGD